MRWNQRGESRLASNHFLMCTPQSGPLRDVHEVIQRRKEGGRRHTAQGAQLCPVMPQRGGRGWEPEGRSRRGDACIHVGDSLCGTAETITILQRNYIPIKSKNKIKPWGKKRNSTNQKNHLLFIKGCHRIT